MIIQKLRERALNNMTSMCHICIGKCLLRSINLASLYMEALLASFFSHNHILYAHTKQQYAF